jgi:hypothetical protein
MKIFIMKYALKQFGSKVNKSFTFCQKTFVFRNVEENKNDSGTNDCSLSKH